jgi:hypothetical protein
MGKHRLAAFAVVLLSAAGTIPAYASGNANFLIGWRQLGDQDFWKPDDGQSVAGVMVDFGKDRWPIHLCLANMTWGPRIWWSTTRCPPSTSTAVCSGGPGSASTSEREYAS